METQVIVQNNGSAEWNLDGTCRSTELPVLIINPQGGKSAAVQLVVEAVPPDVDGLPLSYIRFDDYDSDGNINMIAVYDSEGAGGDDNSEEEAQSTISITGGGGSSHVTEALTENTVIFDEGRIKKHPRYGIGWNGKNGTDSDVAGVDTVAPNCKLVITKKFKVSALTTAYIRKCLKLIGSVNNSSFKGWERGEVLFEDFSYSVPDNAKKIDVTFNFAIQMNEKNYDYKGHKISKLGWEYVWGITDTVVNRNTNRKELKMVSAYKSQIYPYADFSGLGL